MRVGLALPQFSFSVPGERPLRWHTVLDWARRAEGLGFNSLWLADHLFWELSRYGGPPEPGPSFDPLPALAALARHTSRPRLGTLVLCAPLRPATLLGKALATLDVISSGRLTVGIGAGWYEPEFAAAGIAFHPPRRRLAELGDAIAALRRTWSPDEPPPCLPGPVQRPHPPIWVGGKGDALLRLVARHADGWNTVWQWTPESYRERLGALERACEQVERDPASVTRSLGLYALVGEDEADLARRYERLKALSPPGIVDRVSLAEWRRGRLVGTVEQVRAQLAAWEGLGVSELIVNTGAAPFVVGHPDDMEMVAEACSLMAPWEASELQS
jgi:alkanesulfonate monooxygenase SsuD/methylene tetrahydromethanopterin reductase-like flavin-dependent oxidoreductase (luciferase family)